MILFVFKYLALLITITTGLLGALFSFEKNKRRTKWTNMSKMGKFNVGLLVLAGPAVLLTQAITDYKDYQESEETRAKQDALLREVRRGLYPFTMSASYVIDIDSKAILSKEDKSVTFAQLLKLEPKCRGMLVGISIGEAKARSRFPTGSVYPGYEMKESELECGLNPEVAKAEIKLANWRSAIIVVSEERPLINGGSLSYTSLMDLPGKKIHVVFYADSRVDARLRELWIGDARTGVGFTLQQIAQRNDREWDGVIPPMNEWR